MKAPAAEVRTEGEEGDGEDAERRRRQRQGQGQGDSGGQQDGEEDDEDSSQLAPVAARQAQMRAIMRGARELAVMTSISHPNIVQVGGGEAHGAACQGGSARQPGQALGRRA